MKKVLLCIALISGSLGFAQQLEAVNEQLQPFTVNDLIQPQSEQYRTTTCTADTVLYNTAKATASSGLNINNATSAYAICQYYDAPTTLTIEGAQFVGRKADATGGTTISVTVEVYAAGADSLPTGAALASNTITIDTNFYAGSLALLTKTVTFGSPVTVSAPYVVVVENNTATSVSLYSSSYTAGDGGDEWLASANIAGNWLRSYDLVVGGTPYDADMFFHPIVSYDIDNDFILTPDCGTPGIVTFDVTNSPLMQSRMYSSAFFYGAESDQYNWDWDDASALDHVMDTTHNYAAAGPYNVTYTDTLFGWTVTCADATTKSTCSSSSTPEEQINLEVYPNPANDQLMISADQPIDMIQLFDISGKLILVENLVGINQAVLNLNTVSIGSYILTVKMMDGTTHEEKIEVLR